MTVKRIALSGIKKLILTKFAPKVHWDKKNYYITNIIFPESIITNSLKEQGMLGEYHINLHLLQKDTRVNLNLSCGTVNTFNQPNSAELTAAKMTNPKVTLKVINGDFDSEEHGKIYGFANVHIPLQETLLNSHGSENNTGKSLLPLQLKNNLGQRIYSVEINPSDGPVLCINKNLNNGKNQKNYLINDVKLLSLVLKATITEIFTFLFYNSDNESPWVKEWKNYYKNLTYEEFPDLNHYEQIYSDYDEIIKKLQNSFMDKYKFLDRLNSELE